MVKRCSGDRKFSGIVADPGAAAHDDRSLGSDAAAQDAGLSWSGTMKLAILLCACLLAGVAAAAPAGYSDELVQVAPNRAGLANGTTNQPLLGFLARPPGAGAHSAVVILHGCGGFDAESVDEAEKLRSLGYVALALDSLGAANACEKHRQGEAAEARDASAALRWLTRQAFVDGRIAVLGFSMGAVAALRGVEQRPKARESGPHFRAAAAYYPPCAAISGVMIVPTLILVGDRDGIAPAHACQDMMTRRAGRGAAVTLIVYPGATHLFNVPGPPQGPPDARIEYDPASAADAARRVREFFNQQLGRPRA